MLISSYIVLAIAVVRDVDVVKNGCCDFVADDTKVVNAFYMICKSLEFDSLWMLLAIPPCVSSASKVVAVVTVMSL